MVPNGIIPGRSRASGPLSVMSCIGIPSIGSPTGILGDPIGRFRFCFEYISLSMFPSSDMFEWSGWKLNMSADADRWMCERGGDWLAITGSACETCERGEAEGWMGMLVGSSIGDGDRNGREYGVA